MATYSRKSLSHIISTIEKAKSDLPIEAIFLNQLEASIEKTEADGARPPSKTYKPSGMNCMRACFYTILGFPCTLDSKSSSLAGICESGTDRHIRIQMALEAMKKNGYDLEYIDVETYINNHGLADRLQVVSKEGMETKLYMPELNMSFMTDGIIKFQGKYYIFEFKTEIPNKFYKRTGVDPAHYTQGVAYSCAFDIPEVIFLYENRATCEHKSYRFEVNEAMKQDRIYDFISDCNSYIENKTVPPLPIDADIIKKCKYCSYKALCASHGVGCNVTVELPNMGGENSGK